MLEIPCGMGPRGAFSSSSGGVASSLIFFPEYGLLITFTRAGFNWPSVVGYLKLGLLCFPVFPNFIQTATFVWAKLSARQTSHSSSQRKREELQVYAD